MKEIYRFSLVLLLVVTLLLAAAAVPQTSGASRSYAELVSAHGLPANAKWACLPQSEEYSSSPRQQSRFSDDVFWVIAWKGNKPKQAELYEVKNGIIDERPDVMEVSFGQRKQVFTAGDFPNGFYDQMEITFATGRFAFLSHYSPPGGTWTRYGRCIATKSPK